MKRGIQAKDTVRFEINHVTDESLPGGHYDAVDIVVNERSLTDLLKEIEHPFALAEGHTEIAGNYRGLPPDVVFLPSQHLLRHPNPDYMIGDKALLLECDCRIPSCWPFVARIIVGEKTVIWSDFSQPHRNRPSPAGNNAVWSYEALKPFVFDRTQYSKALARESA